MMGRLLRIAAPVALAILSQLPAMGVEKQDPKVPADPFSTPTGRFAVGVHEYLWVDQNRGEKFTSDPSDKRHLMVRVWYPAEASPGKEAALYISDVNQFSEKSMYRQYNRVRTHSVLDAPLAKTRDPFPILIYNHGGGATRFIGTFETEELASHGYIVVSADHLGWAAIVAFPDGYRFNPDAHGGPAREANTRDYINKMFAWLHDDVFPEWVADAHFVLDKIEELNRMPGLFHHLLDLSRIGMMGWSLGGATSIQVSKDDPRVKAAINYDGQQFYGDVTEKGTPRPFMLMLHGEADKAPSPEDADLLREIAARTKNRDQSLMDHSTSQWYQVTIANTQHEDFSDLSLFSSREPGQIDPRRAHQIINAYTLAFFDKYLRGKDSELLNGPSNRYPEVAFKKKNDR